MSQAFLRVYESGVVSGSLDEVWKLIGSFCNVPLWHPAVKESIIEEFQADNKIGSVRKITFYEGEPVRERLLAYDELNHSYTYTVVEGLPLENYISTIRLLPVTENNHTFVEWKSEFYCAPDNKEMLEGMAKGVYTSGIASLKRAFQK
ncbi:hypothetical protein ABK040_016747 [Willaertia magna]